MTRAKTGAQPNDHKAGRRRSSAGRVRVGPLLAIPELLRERGHDHETTMAAAGLSPAQFIDPDTEVPYLAVGRLLAHCVATTKCGHFGLLAGRRAGPSSLGIAGFMLQSAPDVGTALRDLVQHLGLHDRGGSAVLETQNDVSRLGYVIHQPGVEAADQIHDLSIAIGCNIMRGLCGEAWKPTEVLLPRRPPTDPAPFSEFFRCPVHFNADRSALAFPTRWLDHKPKGSDALMHQYFEKEAAKQHEFNGADIVLEVRTRLRKSMLIGQYTAAGIAEQLCLHERTLHRRLRHHGTSFRQEAEAVRYDLARRLLAETDLPITRIATSLGYGDTSAFSRAFKRWTGGTPALWRARN